MYLMEFPSNEMLKANAGAHRLLLMYGRKRRKGLELIRQF
jgi:hypothetical protein